MLILSVHILIHICIDDSYHFEADYMRADTDDFTVARYFEAYLLWLFGWVMFCSSQGDSCPQTAHSFGEVDS